MLKMILRTNNQAILKTPTQLELIELLPIFVSMLIAAISYHASKT